MFRTVWMSIGLQVKQSWARETYRFCLIVQPVVYTFMMYALYSLSKNQNFMSFVVLGSGIITLWSAIAFSSAGDLDRERRMGTFKNILCTPTDYRIVVFSKVLGNTLLGLVPMLVLLLLSFFFKREYFRVAHTGLFLAAFAGMIVSFMSMSLIFSAIFTLSKKTRIFMNCLEFPIYIFCGITFSVTYLPVQIRWISWFLSPTWAVELMRMSINGVERLSAFWADMGVMMGLSACYFALAYFLLGVVEKKVRVDGTLEVS